MVKQLRKEEISLKKRADIIIPVYNSEKTLSRTLESLYKQTYKNFRVLIVNDSSADRTLEIAHEFDNKLDMTIINLQSNKGVSYARNVGIERTSGEYILFIDSDDSVDERYVEHLLDADEKSDFVIIQYRRNIDENKPYVDEATKEISVNDFKSKCWDLWSKFRITNVWGVRYKRDIIIKNNIKFNTELKWGEDTEFNLSYLSNSKGMIALPYAEYVYFINQHSVSRNYEKKRFDYSLEVAKSFAAFAPDSEQLWMIKYIYWDMAIRHGINHLNDKKDKIWKTMIVKEMKRAMREPFFRDCIVNVLKKGSLDMKIYVLFLKVQCIRPYIFIAKKMNW